MTSELKTTEKDQNIKVMHQGSSSEAVYGLGLIGAWVYYIRGASTWQERLIGFLKGIIWPALLVYALLEFLNKERPA
jgi:hypothetical protein